MPSEASSDAGRPRLTRRRRRRHEHRTNPHDTNWRITNLLPRINDVSHDDGLFMEQLNSAMARPPDVEQRLREFVEGKAKPLQAPKES